MLGDLTMENGPKGILAKYMVDLRIRHDNYPYLPDTVFGGGGIMMFGHLRHIKPAPTILVPDEFPYEYIPAQYPCIILM